MTWGELAAAVSRAADAQTREPYLGGFETRDLAQITADMIAWQESGYSTDGMALPPVYAVVRLIASTIDQLDIQVDWGLAPLWLRSPRRFGGSLDQGDLVQWIVTSMALHGAGYLMATRTGESWRLDAVHPTSVQPQSTTTGVVSISYHVNGVEVPRVPAIRQAWQDGRAYLVPIPYLVTPQHPYGCSPITVARESINGYFAVERQASRLLDNGTHSGGRLETDQDISPATAERYQERWMANRREGKMPVTGSGLHYVNDLINPKDAQWLESRAFNMAQVCAMYGVPMDYVGLTMIGGASSLSYSNAQDNNARFRRNALEHFTTQIADALSTLLPPGRNGEEAQEVTFDYERWEGTDADAATASPAIQGQ